MPLSLGNISIGKVYLGSTKINLIYKGSQLVYTGSRYPWLAFEFSSTRFTPTTSLVNSTYANSVVWKQESTSPNIWVLEIHNWGSPQEQMGIGIPALFSSNDGTTGTLVPSRIDNGTCRLVGSGNWDVQFHGYYCESFDRTFSNCTGLISINTIENPHLINVGGMFQGCVNMDYGQYDQYDYFNTYATGITNHSGTFSNCGSDSTTGAVELAQIPVGWGGTLVPASTEMVSYRGRMFNNYDLWEVSTYTYPIFPNISGMYILTQSSVSSYAGVSMNRSRIRGINGLGVNTNYALYFYPCFMRYSGSALTWCYVTSGYNGMLAVGQGNTDMPGTLDYSAYGPFTYEFGTYDTLGTPPVYFCFLVTNVPIDQWEGLSDKYGILYNGNFKQDAGLRYFF